MPPGSSFNFKIPAFETKRLLFRAQTLDDFPASCALWANEAVTRYIGGKPLSAEETWSRMLRNLGHWAMLGFGSWRVDEKTTGGFVGEVGIFDYRRELEPPLAEPLVNAQLELGWVISPAMQGKGYASESAAAVLAWASGQRLGERGLLGHGVACLIHPENAASLRVAEKCGFRVRYSTTYKGNPTLVLSRGA